MTQSIRTSPGIDQFRN